jgi:tripartite-type tricarboxylate transporter receptor subunit TctC
VTKTTTIDRRHVLVGAASVPPALAASFAALPAFAQAPYPNKELRVVCNYPAGSGADIITRWFATKLGELAKQTVIVDNKVGAAGNIATEFAARAKPDGYTLLLTPAFTTMAGAKHLFKTLPFDPVKDFVPITTTCAASFVLVTDPKQGYKTLADLTAALKAKPKGRTGYGTVTNTSTAASEMYGAAIGVEFLKVLYKSTPEATNDMFQGQLDFVISDAGSAMADIKSGKLTALAWTTDYRPEALPDVPTFIESGFKDINFLAWWGVFAPAGTPQAIVDSQAAWWNQIVAMPETKAFFTTMSVEVVKGDAAKLKGLLEKGLKDWEMFVKVGKIEPA